MPLNLVSTSHSAGKETFINPNAQDTTETNKICNSENENQLSVVFKTLEVIPMSSLGKELQPKAQCFPPMQDHFDSLKREKQPNPRHFHNPLSVPKNGSIFIIPPSLLHSE